MTFDARQALDDKSKERLGFERELYKYLDRLMTELRAKKRRNDDRLAADAAIPISAEDQVLSQLPCQGLTVCALVSMCRAYAVVSWC